MVFLNTVVRWLPKGHVPPCTSGGQKYDQQYSWGRGRGEEEVEEDKEEAGGEST